MFYILCVKMEIKYRLYFWGIFYLFQFDNFLYSKFDKKVEVKVYIVFLELFSMFLCLSGEIWIVDVVENVCYGFVIKFVFMVMEIYQLLNVCNGLRNFLW